MVPAFFVSEELGVRSDEFMKGFCPLPHYNGSKGGAFSEIAN